MPYLNQGLAGQSPTLYFPTGTDADLFKDCYMVYGESDIIYPVPDVSGGLAIVGADDRRWAFTFQDIGNDVPTDIQIDRVALSLFISTPWGKLIRPYFRTGGVKYYSGEEESATFIVEDSMRDYTIYGNDFANAAVLPPGLAEAQGIIAWSVNPATNAPWTLAQIQAGEFGFETDALANPPGTATDTLVLGGAFVKIYWGWGTTPAGGGGGDPLPGPCGQSVTSAGVWTNYRGEILDVSPVFGPLTGGTRVQVRGMNFVTGSTITIGGTAATDVVFVDSEHYLFTTPSHPVGFVDIVINEPGGSTIKRNAFQYTLFTRGEDIRRLPSVSIRMGLNSGSNSASFSVDGDSNPPKVGEQIQLIDEEQTPRRLLFAGNVQSITQDYEGQNNQLVWHCEAVDYTWLLNRRRPFGEYVQVSASDIVKDLIKRYAPGFTVNFVQSNLAKISVFFDGTLDLQSCLSILSRMIGGGHWYVDFNQDVHFFHVIPPNVSMPTLPQVQSVITATATVQNPTVTGTGGGGSGVIQLGPGTALTATESATEYASGFTMSMGFAVFQVTFVYDDGVESAYGPASAPVGLDGSHQVVFTNIPTGSAVAGRSVVKRRIYRTYWGPNGGGKRYGYVQINNNSTTGFTDRGPTYSSAAVVSAHSLTPPSAPFVPPPPYGSTQPPNAALSTTLTSKLGQPEYRPSNSGNITWTSGNYRFRVSNIYEDLTESKMGPESNGVASNGSRMVALTNIPRGTAIEGVSVIARRIWGTSGPLDTDFFSWWVIPNNSASSATIAPTTGGAQITAPPVVNPPIGDPPPAAPDRPRLDNPVWPNADGPYLEDFDLPDDITDDNPDLLRTPQVTSTVELSQIRNRVFVRGAGSSTTAYVNKGATTIPVQDGWFYSTQGGQVFSEGSVINYTGLSATSGPANLIVPTGVPEDLNQGAPVSLYLMVEDADSQRDIGAIEVDKNGKPTDGVHEFIISDGSLITPFQMYMRGWAEMELYSRPITTVRYATRDPKTRPGAKIKINLTNPPIVGEFLIQDVQIDQFHDESDEVTPRYIVTTSSAKFDLDDLFFQWAHSTSNTPTPNGNAPAPTTGIGPGPGGPIIIIDPRDPDADDEEDEDPETRPFYIGADNLTSHNWVTSQNLFVTTGTSLSPSQTANKLQSDFGAATMTVSNRGFSHSTGFLYTPAYTRGSQQPVRRWSRGTDEALFTVPLDPIFLTNDPSNIVNSAGGILDWCQNAAGTKLYFTEGSLSPSGGQYSRVMEYDLTSGAVRAIGQPCAPATIPSIPQVIANPCRFFAVHEFNDELYAGVGIRVAGFNSTAAGIYKLVGALWTRVLDLSPTEPAGESPMCFATYNGLMYCGLRNNNSGAARLLVSGDGTTWTTSTTIGGATAANEWSRLLVAEGELYACSYENAATDVTRIHKFDGTTWTIVKQINAQTTNVKRAVNVIAHASRMFVMALDAISIGRMLISDNGRDWTASADLPTVNSVFGVDVS